MAVIMLIFLTFFLPLEGVVSELFAARLLDGLLFEDLELLARLAAERMAELETAFQDAD